MPRTAATLSQEQIATFRHQQYLVIDNLIDEAEVTVLRDIYDRLIRERAGYDEGLYYDLGGIDDDEPVLPQLVHPDRYAPELNESKLLRIAAAITKQLLGHSGRCFFFHMIYKPARIGAETPWHQDASYWPIGATWKTFTIWVPLQEATPRNGCMEFVPGSHLLGVLPHRSIDDDPRIHGNELRPDQMHHVKGVVTCPLPAGGATLHGSHMLHHTAPNISDEPRRALILLGEDSSEDHSGTEFYPWMLQKATAREQRFQAAMRAGLSLADTRVRRPG
jgi:ectoine hydroxylase-related dioxygenase (phytanoyl-CoA dioxygenase family)